MFIFLRRIALIHSMIQISIFMIFQKLLNCSNDKNKQKQKRLNFTEFTHNSDSYSKLISSDSFEQNYSY